LRGGTVRVERRLDGKTLGRCPVRHSEPRACRRLLRSQLHRIGLASSQRARPHRESFSI
jgi:hypothetical protein